MADSDFNIELPKEVWEIILKNLKSCECRNTARLVCSLWRDLLNRDCSTENMIIRQKIYFNPDYWQTFLNSRRFRIHYILEGYFPSDMLDDFLTHCGSIITSLKITEWILGTAQFGSILSSCKHLKILKLKTAGYNWFETPLCQGHESMLKHQTLQEFTIYPQELYKDYYNNSENLIKYIGNIRLMFPKLKHLALRIMKKLPYRCDIESLVQMQFNLFLFFDDEFENELWINPDNKWGVVVKNGSFKLNSFNDTTMTDLTHPSGTSERSLLNFMHEHSKVMRRLKIEFTIEESRIVLFPPLVDEDDCANLGFELLRIEIFGTNIIQIANCPALFNKLEALLFNCHVVNFTETIHQLQNLKYLQLISVSYDEFVSICNNLPTLEYLSIKSCTRININIGHKQQNIKKLKNLKSLSLPEELLLTEECDLPNSTNTPCL